MLRIDFSLALQENIGGEGISKRQLMSSEDEIKRAVDYVLDDEPGYMRLPYVDVSEIKRFAEMSRGKYEDVVVLGIGGSALGTITARDALKGTYWNVFDGSRRKGLPRLWVLDNVDPDYVGGLMGLLVPNKTLVIAISKSGSTAETMAQFLIFKKWLLDAGLELQNHLVIITDPEKGYLRRFAGEYGIVSFDVPPDVGGRFSVLSPVGLVPLSLIGINVDALLDGARRVVDYFRSAPVLENAPALYAYVKIWMLKHGKNISVLMPYSNRLFSFAYWYRQLWAESLGKRFNLAGKEVFVGQTPVAALGTTDQHSQIQLYNEGPADKLITFLRLAEFPMDVEVPGEDAGDLVYLAGPLSRLINAEADATALALAKNGRPSITIWMDKIDELHLGMLFVTFELATSVAGALLGINPYDQPGVELGKLLTYGLMGREGYDQYARQINDFGRRLEKFVLQIGGGDN